MVAFDTVLLTLDKNPQTAFLNVTTCLYVDIIIKIIIVGTIIIIL